VRIDTIRTGTIGARSAAARSGSGVAFHVQDVAQTQRTQGMAQATPAQDIGSLLALQSVEDPLLKKKKLVRRGRQLLDTLEEVQADLLVGRISEGRLHQLVALLSQARDRSEPGLDALLDDIELRVQVELAKRGIYASR
jgi:hypothetical protein